jgi:hypothetical protein
MDRFPYKQEFGGSGYGACVNCCARRYFVSTVGRNEGVIRESIRNQRNEDNIWDARGGS